MADSSNTNQSSNQNAQPSIGFQAQLSAAMRFMNSKRLDTFLLGIRLATIFFTLSYLFPITGFSSASLYQKALLANAAISAFRLNQRLPSFQFSREYLMLVMIEDSAHYLMYSLIFISGQPVTLVLLPITLFALLHSSSFLLKVINVSTNENTRGNFLATFVERYQREIFLTIALTEIALMPTIIFAIIAGLLSFFTPLMYYQFLVLRYASRRNPYTRQAFHWLRISCESFANSPRCPDMAKNAIHKSIELVCRLAPPQV